MQPAGGRRGRDGRSDVVSFVIPAPAESGRDGHRFGVNALCANRAGEKLVLYSAGRDAVIRSWNVSELSGTPPTDGIEPPPFEPELLHRFSGHTDWVNDVLLFREKFLASGSSDTTVALWNAENGRRLQTLARHTDYVSCLAWSPSCDRLASGGFDSNVFIWDVETGQASERFSEMIAGEVPERLRGQKHSVYSLATASGCPILVAGSPGPVIRGWDMRNSESVFSLRGHSDNVRSLLLSADGKRCISGSSDRSIRVWDVRMMKQLCSLSVHAGGVFALLALDDSLRRILSGGRDGRVNSLEFYEGPSSGSLSSCACVFKIEQPVLGLELFRRHESAVGAGVWVCSTKNTIECMAVDLAGMAKFEGPKLPEPAQSCQVRARISGLPGLVSHRILNNRRLVLAQDNTGCVSMWDVVRAARVREFGRDVDIDKLAEEELLEMTSVPTWFSIDTKIGSITVHLEYPSALAGEVYAVDAGFADPSETVKISLGESALLSLYRAWLVSRRAAHADLMADELDGNTAEEEEAAEGQARAERVRLSPLDGFPVVPGPELKHRVPLSYPAQTMLVVGPRSARIDEMGSFAPEFEAMVPRWVKEVLLSGLEHPNAGSRLRFYLLPSPSQTELEYLPHGSVEERGKGALNGLYLTRVSKLCKYVTDNLRLPVPDGSVPHKVVELRCQDKPLEPGMTLRTVKAFIWRRPGDLVMYYCLQSDHVPPKSASGAGKKEKKGKTKKDDA